MSLIDNEKDYFLHDFSKSGAESDSPGEFTFPPQPGDDRRPRPRRRGRRILFWIITVAILAAAGAFYVRYFVPHTTETRTRGYITLVEKRGIVFKTFECEMVSESRLADTTRVYSRDMVFSIPTDSLGRLLQTYQSTGRPVTVTTKSYYGTLPWRGATNIILTDIQP